MIPGVRIAASEGRALSAIICWIIEDSFRSYVAFGDDESAALELLAVVTPYPRCIIEPRFGHVARAALLNMLLRWPDDISLVASSGDGGEIVKTLNKLTAEYGHTFLQA